MPVHHGKDRKGSYYQWGSRKKYYYKKGSELSKSIAYNKAKRQGIAIKISQSRRRK